MKMLSLNKRHVQLALLLLLCAFSVTALAGEPMPWDNGLKKFGDALTGPTAMYVSLIAFAACMYGLIWGGEMGDLMKKIVMIVLAGSTLVGSASIAKTLLGVQVTGAVIETIASLPMHTVDHASRLFGVA